MNPNLLSVVFHLGSIIKTIKDIEQGVQHVIEGNASEEDAKAILDDLLGLVRNGIINIPGVSEEQITKALSEFKSL